MAIEVNRVPLKLATAQSITTTGDKTTYRPGYYETIVYAVSVVVTTAVGGDVAQLTVDHRPVVGSNTGRTTIATINLPASLAVGQVRYREGLNFTVRPGGEIVLAVPDASAAGAVDVELNTAQVWAQPLNNTAMVVST